MSEPLSDKPGGTTANAHVANTCLQAEELHNKTPIFISRFGDARSFPAWLRASCSGCLTTQIKGERLMVSHQSLTGSELRSAHCSPLTGRTV